MAVGEYNWDAWSHAQLHGMINGRTVSESTDGEGTTRSLSRPNLNAKGVQGSVATSDAWRRFTELMASAEERTKAAIARAGASWEGAAADAMASGMNPLAQWAADAATAGSATQSGHSALVDYYASAKNSVPEPVAVDSTANSDFFGIPAGFTHLLGGQTDQDVQERAAQQAKAEAVRVLNDYQANSASAASGLGQFVAPPTVVAEVGGAQQPEHNEVRQRTGTVDQLSAERENYARQWEQQKKVITGQPNDGRPDGIAQPPQVGGNQDGGDTQRSGTGRTDQTNQSDWQQSTVRPGLIDHPAYRPGPVVPPVGTPPPTVPPGFLPPGGVSPVGGPGGTGGSVRGGSGVGDGRSGAGIGGGRAGAGVGGGRAGAGTGVGGGRFGAGLGPEGGSNARGGLGTRGPGAVAGALGEAAGARPGAAGSGSTGAAAGARGAAGAGAMGGAAGGRGGKGEEDKEHRSAAYLQDSHDDFWLDDTRVAPPVIGEQPQR
ncbi:PPE domain-containing protein [Goodfellowiella coeruleoviolacea]|uniref:PPE-repeat protein n=1 Tax=Goodfellowiella coeruleoviolacea TaxID=334858 RepID=A0AAE3GDM9_9PSEU|nr:PPE domain-containing protein [Goodfellowiella coeruleoviolacea]MCP2165357.1 PPE-repeat protein [Goodfellowiella coeruleoviolacea]